MAPIPFSGYSLLTPADQVWKTARPMQVPYTDLLEHTGSENLGARLWRLPPSSANTWHRHVKVEEYYFVLEGVGRLRIGAIEREFAPGEPFDLKLFWPEDPKQLPPELATGSWPPAASSR